MTGKKYWALTARVTAEEHQRLAAAAQLAGEARSEIIRRGALQEARRIFQQAAANASSAAEGESE